MDCKNQKIKAYLGLGTNLGNKKMNLDKALSKLATKNITLLKTSSLYETAPWGGVEQDDFWNMVALIETELSPKDLLQALKTIEVEVGRKPSVRWGPRIIDIDILTYGDETFTDETLNIPHKEMANRGFVLLPLMELNPNLEIPTRGNIKNLVKNLPPAEQEIKKL